jgi:hypothetical protein
MAEENPEFQSALRELDRELEVRCSPVKTMMASGAYTRSRSNRRAILPKKGKETSMGPGNPTNMNKGTH